MVEIESRCKCGHNVKGVAALFVAGFYDDVKLGPNHVLYLSCPACQGIAFTLANRVGLADVALERAVHAERTLKLLRGGRRG